MIFIFDVSRYTQCSTFVRLYLKFACGGAEKSVPATIIV